MLPSERPQELLRNIRLNCAIYYCWKLSLRGVRIKSRPYQGEVVPIVCSRDIYLPSPALHLQISFAVTFSQKWQFKATHQQAADGRRDCDVLESPTCSHLAWVVCVSDSNIQLDVAFAIAHGVTDKQKVKRRSRGVQEDVELILRGDKTP